MPRICNAPSSSEPVSPNRWLSLREQLHALGVGQLFPYGSVARNEAREDSDVDLLLEPSNQRFSIFDLVGVRVIWPTTSVSFAIERLLIQFGEALKSVPNPTLTQIDSNIVWAGPKGFRDIASHWYEEGLDHRLIWHALANDLPPMLDSLQRWIDGSSDPGSGP